VLKERCDEVHAGLGEAVTWVNDVRPTARRLDRDADGLVETLRRNRNLCRRLSQAAERPLSIGVFGMSQAGKSYLISTLARAEHGELFTELESKRFNFISHVNPPGGGKEATGLVTRFTRRPVDGPAGFPIRLTLFSEADLVKILGNSFFHDFDRERVNVVSDPDEIRKHLARFEALRRPQPTGGLDEDAMVDLMDYFERRFARSMEPLRSDFSPTVIHLAPRLAPAERGELLSVLWGGIAELTRVYVQLRNVLQGLSNARTVYAPIEALVVAKDGGYAWNEQSIVNVDVLNKLGKDDATPLNVVPMLDGRAATPVGVPRSVLTALTAEMTFVLADPPVASLLERVDLPDFPGYRGRLAVTSLDDVRKELKRADADPVAQLLLRGKVAYLFERYTEDQEMNILLMCTRSDQQIEITTLAPVLTSWVHATQGENPAARAGRPPGLVWVLTQLDRRLEPKPGQTETQQRQEWANMIHITLLERFSQAEWLHEWSPGRSFDNVFLVRKPGFLRSVIETEGDNLEKSLLAGQVERLANASAMFVGDAKVGVHVRDPQAAWDAVLKLNDGGMERLAAYLAQVAVEETKLARIAEQIARLTDDVVAHRLGPYYFAEGADEVNRKEALAARVAQAVEEHADGFGELLFRLQPPSEQLRQLYLRADAAPEPGADGGAAAPAEPPRKRSLIRLPKAESAKSEAPAVHVGGRAWLFAKTVMSAWTKQVRALPDDLDLRRLVGYGRDVLQLITDELIAGADRTRLEDRLVEVLRPLEDKRSTTRVRIVDQQVLLARGIVDDFVDTLGMETTPLAQRGPSTVDGGRKLFEPPPPIAPDALPVLPEEEVAYSGMFVLDWLESFRQLAVGNAGHSAGREITPEQNRRLGAILTRVRGTGAAAGPTV